MTIKKAQLSYIRSGIMDMVIAHVLRTLIHSIHRTIPSEEACTTSLFAMRYSQYACAKCGGFRFSPIGTRPHQNYCLECHAQLSVLTGTLFENTKFAMNQWFLAIFLASRDKRGISALTLSRGLDLSLPTTMAMLRELRGLMANSDQSYHLAGAIEIDAFSSVLREANKGAVPPKTRSL